MKYYETQNKILQNEIMIEMINHYLNVIREKNERVYNPLQNQRENLGKEKETSPGIRQGSRQR